MRRTMLTLVDHNKPTTDDIPLHKSIGHKAFHPGASETSNSFLVDAVRVWSTAENFALREIGRGQADEYEVVAKKYFF